MKIYTNIFIIFCSVIFCNYSQAHTLCVNKESYAYGMLTEVGEGGSDWVGRYEMTAVNPLRRRGVGICSNSSGSVGSVTSEIYRSRTSSAANKYCWSKLLYPAESKFILVAIYDDETDCLQNCTRRAVNPSDGSSNSAEAFFQNLEGSN